MTTAACGDACVETAARGGLGVVVRRDPLLAALAALLTLATCLPLAVTPFLPLQDLPNHVGAASLVDDLLRGDPGAARHYRLELAPVPYWTGYGVLAAAAAVAGPLVAAKVAIALALVVVPLGMMRLLAALRRDPRLGLLAFSLAWDHNLYWGFFAYVLGVGLGLFALARVVEAERPREALRALPLVLLVALTHLQALALLPVLALALVPATARGGVSRRLVVHGVGAGLAIAAAVPWLVVRLVEARETGSSPLSLEWDGLAWKLERFFPHTVDNVPGELGRGVARATVTCTVLIPLALALAPGGWGGIGRLVRGALPLVAAAALYLTLPLHVGGPVGTMFVYTRLASIVLLAALLLPGAPLRGRRALLLVPAALSTVAMSAVVTRQFAAFGTRAREFLTIMAATEPGRSVLPLLYERGDPEVHLDTYDQFHAYLLAAKGGFDPCGFRVPHLPVAYDASAPAFDCWRPWAFTLDEHGRGYEYVLVQGLDADPLRDQEPPAGMRVRRAAEAGMWRLYAVETTSPGGD